MNEFIELFVDVKFFAFSIMLLSFFIKCLRFSVSLISKKSSDDKEFEKLDSVSADVDDFFIKDYQHYDD